jgi:hypothetical protein
MNTMNIPGFTAENVLFQPCQGYHLNGALHVPTHLGVQPQLPIGGGGVKSKCAARCYGAWVGSQITCAFDPNPAICLSIAANVYSRCKTRCTSFGDGGDVGNILV